jgi:hypothetical protein
MDKLITDYIQDISGWETWQKEYRYGVLSVLPPDPPLAEVNKLKVKYDPRGYAICGAHISLTVPLMKGVDGRGWAELQSITGNLKPFTVKYGPVFNVLPAAPGVMLKIEPKEALEKAIAAVETAAAFQGSPRRPFSFYPHMTIAEYVNAAQTKILTEQLKNTAPQGSFECNFLSYIVPDKDFHFTERGQLELKG